MGSIKRKLLELCPYYFVKDKLSVDYCQSIGSARAYPPQIYNKRGERMHVFYLKDEWNVHTPYTLSSHTYPEYIFWDRFNISLDTHFYVHEASLGKKHPCKKMFAIWRESEAIIPSQYDVMLNKPEIIKEFDCVFTHSERLLNKYPNARFAPAGNVWYGMDGGGSEPTGDVSEKKEKNISIISSNKEVCEMHKIRADLTRYYKNSTDVDTFGSAVGNNFKYKKDALEKYRYSIVLENDVAPYYFTEKVLDCFASMTIPIYVGATKIGEFFDTDGMIIVNKDELSDFRNIDKIIKQCSENDYSSRLDAIKKNHSLVNDYLCYEDYLCGHYSELMY